MSTRSIQRARGRRLLIYTIDTIGTPTLKYPYFTSDVTWTYVGLKSINAPANGTLDLGVFTITTAGNLSRKLCTWGTSHDDLIQLHDRRWDRIGW